MAALSVGRLLLVYALSAGSFLHAPRKALLQVCSPAFFVLPTRRKSWVLNKGRARPTTSKSLQEEDNS